MLKSVVKQKKFMKKLKMIIERQWAMPNKNTFIIKPINKLLKKEITGGEWIDPFANSFDFSVFNAKFVTNDLNIDFDTDYHMDALDFLKQFSDKSLDGVLYDPPYSPRQVSECYKKFGKDITMETTQASFWSKHKDEIARIVKPGGKVICFGWNSMGCGINRGFTMSVILLVPHGGSHNDTIITVEVKNKQNIR